jgi:hypothetical protein
MDKIFYIENKDHDKLNIKERLIEYKITLDKVKNKIDYLNNQLDKYNSPTVKYKKNKEECSILDIFFW